MQGISKMSYISINYRKALINFFALIISIIIVCSGGIPLLSTITVYGSNDESWPEMDKEPYGKAAILMERDTGAILYGKDIDEKLYPASITKIMTGLLVVENLSLEDTITFTSAMINFLPPEAVIHGVSVGETMTVEDCLYSLILRSSNDIAVGLAYDIAGGEEEFAKMMTERAKELGAFNTNFVNATGLHNENHYTTARDMALITEAAMSNPIFSAIWGAGSYVIHETNMSSSFTIWHRHDMFVKGRANYYEDKKGIKTTVSYTESVVIDKEYNIIELTGGKTGFTDEAGRTLVTVAKNNEMELISVILYSTNEYVYDDTKALIEYGFNSYKKIAIEDNEERFGQSNNTGFSIINNEPLFILGDESVVIPNNIRLSDVDYKYDNNINDTGRGEFARITYIHEDKVLGSTILYSSAVYNKEKIYSLSLEKENQTIEVANNQEIMPISIYYIIGGITLLFVFVLIILIRVKLRRRHNINNKFYIS